MRCANPPCKVESSYLRSGSLYSIDEVVAHAGRRRRFIWLCSTCAPHFVVETWRPPGQQLRPSASLPAPAAPPQRVDTAIGAKSVRRLLMTGTEAVRS